MPWHGFLVAKPGRRSSMTDNPTTLETNTTRPRDRLKQAGAIIPILRPAMRYLPKNPVLLIGAAVVGVAGVLAWRNREKISRTASPIIDDARSKGQALIEEARTKGEELIEQAKVTTEAVAAKAKGGRRKTAAAPSEIH